MLTKDLKKSNANEVVHGKLIINLTTNVSAPPNHPGSLGNMRASTSHERGASSTSGPGPREDGSSVPISPQNGAGPSGTTNGAVNGNSRPFSSFEDQHGPLPPG